MSRTDWLVPLLLCIILASLSFVAFGMTHDISVGFQFVAAQPRPAATVPLGTVLP